MRGRELLNSILNRRPSAAIEVTPQSELLHIDESFSSLAEWKAWTSTNSAVVLRSTADQIAARILQNGIVEPLSGHVIQPKDIQNTGNNWREGLIANGLNSRIRATIALIEQFTADFDPDTVAIFATEAVTSFAGMLRGKYPRFLGSEYAVDDRVARHLYPIMHQDLTALSLPSDIVDLVTTNEVLEHVPDIDAALSEIARVLKPGGWHIGTFPFLTSQDDGDIRARIVNGEIVHLKQPEYHGNPVDANGSLVFETPGWNIVQRALSAGFSRAHMRFVASELHGYIGGDTCIQVFCAQK